MMKKCFTALTAIVLLSVISCTKDDVILTTAPELAIINVSAGSAVAQEDTLYFKAVATEGSSLSWLVDGVTTHITDSVFKFVSGTLGAHTVSVTAVKNDKQSTAQTGVTVYGKYKYGTFVLNEGNMTTENGSLIFISPKGVVTDSAYFKANGTELGNVTQDLFISNNKIYIISQNGKKNPLGTGFENDGMLVVANAETLKKEAAYNDELAMLSWPTHVAVLNEQHVFLRDNNGIYRFNTATKTLTFIKGSKSAAKLTMAVSNNKVFAAAGTKVYVIEADKDTLTNAIDMKGSVSGVIRADDGNIWVSTTTAPAKISKVNYRDYSLIKANEISTGSLSAGWGATPGITAKGDTLYFSGAGTKIYRHVFSTNATEFMVDAKTMVQNANIVYNNIAVHPLTGEVYLNTIKAYGWDFLVNNISVFNFSNGTKLSANYNDYTNFPAGIFFTYNFK